MDTPSPFEHAPTGSESLNVEFEWGHVWCGLLGVGSYTPPVQDRLLLMATDARSRGQMTRVSADGASSHVLSASRVAVLPASGSVSLHWDERAGLVLARLSPHDLIAPSIDWQMSITRPLVLHAEPGRTFGEVLLQEGFSEEPRERVLRSIASLLLHTALDQCTARQPHRRAASAQPGSCATPSLTAADLQAVRTYVDRHLCDRISVEDLANVVGFSAPHFSRLFKATLGVTPYQYVIERRLDRASHLLTTTSRPVYDIALEVGYGHVSHFSRAFKLQFGRTPSDLR